LRSDVRYRIVVEGELGPRYSTAFEGMDVRRSEGVTVIVGDLQDQAQLVGLVNRIAGLGLKLVRVEPDDPAR
jgi:hypothetical protein